MPHESVKVCLFRVVEVNTFSAGGQWGRCRTCSSSCSPGRGSAPKCLCCSSMNYEHPAADSSSGPGWGVDSSTATIQAHAIQAPAIESRERFEHARLKLSRCKRHAIKALSVLRIWSFTVCVSRCSPADLGTLQHTLALGHWACHYFYPVGVLVLVNSDSF